MSLELANSAVTAMQLICSLQLATPDGDAFVGPERQVSIAVAGETALVRGSGEFGLDIDWRASPGWHGSVELKPQHAKLPLVGLIVPRKDKTFGVFWANTERLKANGAPITQVAGDCQAKSSKHGDGG